jgi:rare lipoprotein A
VEPLTPDPHEHCPAGNSSRRAARTPPVFLSAAFALAVLSGCAHRNRPAAPLAPRVGAVETGIASWYGYPYHGRRAANGEIYDMEQFTAAHRTLPFGTWVDVYDLDNGKRVQVRITDRGPFIEGRIIDLSRAAARAIDMLGPGTARVRIQIIDPPASFVPPKPPSPAPDPSKPNLPKPAERAVWYAVQTAAFTDRALAEQQRADLLQRYGAARVVLSAGNPPVWRVLVGREATIDSANALAERIRAEIGQGTVVRLDEP